MPGFILHLTSAKMLLNQLPDHPHFPYMIASENDFMTGLCCPMPLPTRTGLISAIRFMLTK